MKKVTLLLSLLLFIMVTPAMAGVNLMTKEELKPMLGQDDVVVIDVRAGRDWSSSEFIIKGALRAPDEGIVDWAKQFDKNTTLVLYCA